jgi:shikimate dehydrogenase
MKCGVLGRKLGHSYSPQIHKHLGDYEFHIFEKEPEELVDFLQNGDFSGTNVTIPYKKDVIPYLDEISPIAQKLGAVNIIVRRDGKLIGHNSDHFGFQSMVEKSGLSPAGKKCLVLGSGGASATVQSVLKDFGAQVVVISRSGENNYDNLHLHADAAIIVNTTPLGMYPHTGEAPLDVSRFPKLEGILDIVYNPARTQIMLDAENLGIPTMNGLWMLVAQAKEAAEWFTNSVISDEKISEIYEILRRQMENIVLIGMPGCGKSTVGKQLAEITGKEFVDADEKIAQLSGKSIPEIFAQDGEEVFRSFETKALEELGKRSGLVIATGGGCVTKARNYPLLHQNGTIIWLKRDLDQLPTDGRPLSQANDLTMMYETRKPMYEAFADYAIDNNDSVTDTVHAIGELI